MRPRTFSEKIQLACQCALLLVVCSCAVGPDYTRPEVTDITPEQWHWKLAQPRDAVPRGPWWKVFDDLVLDELETYAVSGSQTLRSAVARVDESRAVARIARSQFFPQLSLDPLLSRQRTSANQPLPIPIQVSSVYYDTFSVPFDLSYEVDLWGRVRRSFESAHAQAQASVADYQNVLLTLTADVAVNYFLIRSLDKEIAVLRQTVALRGETVGLMQDRFTVGTVSEMDVAQAKADLAGAKSDLADATRQRAETLHALAVLCGKAASTFEIAVRSKQDSAPFVPPGLPSSLLERRPDIARAERTLAARSAQVGVAEAAYFPVVRLTGQAGYLSNKAEHFFSADNRIWSIGPSVSLPLFTGGRTAASVQEAKAFYEESLSEYRQTVLIAFKEVEDSIAQIALRTEQVVAQREAVASSARVAEITRQRYEVGVLSYLEVAEAERNALRYARQEVQVAGQRLIATVRLIKALGGGWEEDGPP